MSGWKLRPARGGTLAASLEQTVVVDGRVGLFEYLRERFCFWHPALDTISIVKYGEGIDERCGWDTHLVSIDDKAAVFTDGPLPGARLPGCIDGSHSFTWRMGLGTCRYCFEKKRQKEKSDG